MKYKDIDIDVNQETKERLVRKRKESTSFVLSLIITIFLLGVANCTIPIIVAILSDADKRADNFFTALYINSFVLLGGAILLSSMAKWQSKRRIKYLPLSKETMEELNIYTIEDYCDFLNEFLFVTPTGKEAKEGSLFFGITEIPKEILEEINSNFPVDDGKIAWDDFYAVYVVC